MQPTDKIFESQFQQHLWQEVQTHAVSKKFLASEMVLNENAYVNHLPLLAEGLIGIYRTDADGRELLLYYIQPGESCIMSFLAGLHHGTSKIKAIAEEDSIVYIVAMDKVEEWLKKFPEWTDYIFKLYHQRFEELLDVVNEVAFKKMDERLLHHLERKKQLMHTDEISITHQQLADELGTTREVISRLLKQMEKEQLLKIGRNKLYLTHL
jgi:CRP/FNR family transcriptional regulator